MCRASTALALAIPTLLAALTGTASATLQRTFVSVTGLDANNCSVTAPCRSFGTALAQTTAGGEIVVLDSGGYGPVVINKPVSLTAPAGVYAGISVQSGTGIVVNPVTGIVIMTGLTINGLGGARGIDYVSGDSLILNRVLVQGFTDTGVYGHPGATSSVTIRDSQILNNAIVGIDLGTTSGLLTFSVERSYFEANATGVKFGDNVAGIMADTTIRKSTAAAGIMVPVIAGATNRVTILRCAVVHNTSGFIFGFNPSNSTIIEVNDSVFSDNVFAAIFAQAGLSYFSNTRITRNQTALQIDAAAIAISFGDNVVYQNLLGETFSSTLTRK